MRSLEGKVALVTGAARNIGAEIARALASEGARVAVNYLSSSAEAEHVVQQIASAGGRAAAYRADVADFEAVKTMVDAIVADLGGIDILVNNAGVAVYARFLDTTAEQWRRHLDVGLLGLVNTARAALPYILDANKGGRIIALGGDSSRTGEANLSMAAAARAGSIALIKSLAKEFGRHDVTANAVMLGMIETADTDPASLEATLPKILKNYPLRRIGRPDDVAPMIVFLSGDGGRWVTGQVISVNGGSAML